MGCSAPIQIWQLLQGSISADLMLPFQYSALVGGLCTFITRWWLEPSVTLFFTVSTVHIFYFPFLFVCLIKFRFILHESLSVDRPLISNALNISTLHLLMSTYCSLGISICFYMEQDITPDKLFKTVLLCLSLFNSSICVVDLQL